MKIVFCLSMLGCLAWLIFQLEPESSPPLENPNLTQVVSEPPPAASPPPANPPLPKVTGQKVRTIRQILTDKELDHTGLFNRFSNNENLRILVLERWVEADHQAAIEAAKGTELEPLTWKLVGLSHGSEFLPLLPKIKKKHHAHLLAGIAEVSPQKVIQHLALANTAPAWVTSRSIRHGIAKENIVSALNFDVESYHGEWVTENRFETGGFFFFKELEKWITANPNEAVQWLERNRHEEYGPRDFFVGQLDREVPEMLQEFLDRIPTGKTKVYFLEERKWYREHRSPRRGLVKCRGSNRDQTLFLEILDRAATANITQWQTLLRGDHLRDLPPARAALIREVVIERWIAHSPQTLPSFLFPHEELNAYAMNGWMEFDPVGALAHLYDKGPSGRNERLVELAITRSGTASAATFLEIRERFPDFMYEYLHDSLQGYQPTEFALQIAREDREDREGLEVAAKLEGKWGRLIREILVHAWLDKDFGWVLKKVKEWGTEEEFIWESPFLKTPPFLDHFEKIPSDLREAKIKNWTITAGATLDWLADPNPQIGEEDLKRIFNRSDDRRHYFLPIDSVEIAARLIRESTILNKKSKQLIEEKVHDDLMQQSTAKEREWLESLPQRYKETRLEILDLEAAYQSQQPKKEAPDTVFEVISQLDHLSDSARAWQLTKTPEEKQKLWAELVPQLTAAEIMMILNPGPDKPQAFQKRAENLTKELAESPQPKPWLENRFQNLAWDWAEWEPSAAAVWAVGIPHPRVRENVANAIFFQWKKLDGGEAREWTQTLPEELRKRMGLK